MQVRFSCDARLSDCAQRLSLTDVCVHPQTARERRQMRIVSGVAARVAHDDILAIAAVEADELHRASRCSNDGRTLRRREVHARMQQTLSSDRMNPVPEG
jgi:hypothetical protein